MPTSAWIALSVLLVWTSFVHGGDDASSLPVPSFSLIEEVTKDGFRYLVSKTPATWQTAEAVCAYHGGHLASIASEEEESMVEQICFDVLNVTGCWIGLNDLQDEGHFTYTDSTLFNSSVYSNWYKSSWVKAWESEPNDWLHPGSQEDCVVVMQQRRGWHDEHCNRMFSFVCKAQAPPPPPLPPPPPPKKQQEPKEPANEAAAGAGSGAESTGSTRAAAEVAGDTSIGTAGTAEISSASSSRHRRRVNQQLLWGVIGGITGGLVMFQMMYILAVVMRRRRRYIGGHSWDTSLEAVAVLKQVEMMPPFTIEDLEARASSARERITTGVTGALAWLRRLLRRGYSELPA